VASTRHKLCNTVRHSRRRALVLVLVLIVVMMVALAGFTFADLMLTENKATRVHGEQLRLQQAIASGVEQLKQFVEQPRALQETAGGGASNPRLFQAVPLEPELADTRTIANRLRFSIVSAAVESTNSLPGIRFGVENESARMHLGDVLHYEHQAAGAGRDALLKLPGMTESIAEAILDWIDPDSVARPLGAENDYYGGLDEPYAPRNGLPDCLEELLLVKGVTRELLFGADSNYNRMVEPHEQAGPVGNAARSASGSAPVTPWSWHLTLYSGHRNRDSQGLPRINLNGPSLMELHQKLTSAVGPELAAFVVAYRQHGPYLGTEPATPGVVPFNGASPAAFKISSVLDLAGASVAVPSGDAKSKPVIYQSPLAPEGSALGEQLAKLLDTTTIHNAMVSRGQVSVNDAPAIVLQTVPGIDEGLAQQIVAARQNASGEAASRRYPTWLLTEGLVDLPTMKRLFPYLSGSGDVVRAQVVAHFDRPGLSARAEVVIDGTGQAAQVIAWRDLRFYGTGYPVEWLTTGAPRGARN
jgi:DNA uptake protein ComE-like DNA-binding protein